MDKAKRTFTGIKNKANWRRIQAALTAVLDEHLGPDPDPSRGPGAANIMVSLLLPAQWLNSAMNRKRELDALNRLDRAARAFAADWNFLHPTLQREISRSAKSLFADQEEVFVMKTNVEWERFWNTNAHLKDIFNTAMPKARALIQSAPEIGKSDAGLIDIIHSLRLTWEYRKGKPAPRNVAEGSAFYRFVDAAFDAMELDRDVRAAMDAWRKFTAKYPNAVRNIISPQGT